MDHAKSGPQSPSSGEVLSKIEYIPHLLLSSFDPITISPPRVVIKPTLP